MNEYAEEMFEAQSDFVAKLPKAVREAFDEMMTRLSAMLGESPEAWRGAVIAAMTTMRVLALSHERPSPAEELLMVLSVGVLGTPWARQAYAQLHEEGMRP